MGCQFRLIDWTAQSPMWRRVPRLHPGSWKDWCLHRAEERDLWDDCCVFAFPVLGND